MWHTVIIYGRLTRDPEMRYTPGGQAVTNLNIAVNRNYKTAAGEAVEETMYVRAAAWGRLAEVTNQYLKKGQTVLIEGTLLPDAETGSPRVYQKNDGTYGASFELRANAVKFGAKAYAGEEASGAVTVELASEEEIPF